MNAVIQFLGGLLPEPVRRRLEPELPRLKLGMARLALEVLAAESASIRYRDAVVRVDFPLMARVHFGVLDQLQSRPPPELRAIIGTLVKRAEAGRFDSARRLLFEIARRTDADAALARFLLFQAVRLNLYVNTWEEPLFEAWGSLDRVESEAEQNLRELLSVDELFHPDIRPLHVLVKETLMRLNIDAAQVRERMKDRIETYIDKVPLLADAHAAVRALDARDAAVFRPGLSQESLSSQRIADRFPQHFRNANAVDKRRERAATRWDPDHPPTPPGDRMIDLLLAAAKDHDHE